jgi:hypothetical protein
MYRIGKRWSKISSEVKRKGKRLEQESYLIILSSLIKEHRQQPGGDGYIAYLVLPVWFSLVPH